ncbi:hypothetical protein [Halegenticoccus tardaugens]|uniref:hypothetical protein n=1 Tax=Halegenticoccus tardaugens TaxID=2071624 RepID=UPI001E488E28|nr:hypothetical protein [Halegenticoccus tardaugens]
MALAGVAFIGYGLVFLALALIGSGFELGVSMLDGLTRSELAGTNPEVVYYITHIHVALAGFIIATGIAVAALAWYGVRTGQLWAWATATTVAVVALAIALPMHYTGRFTHDWMAHLAPIYLATIVFVVGAALAFLSIRALSPEAA